MSRDRDETKTISAILRSIRMIVQRFSDSSVLYETDASQSRSSSSPTFLPSPVSQVLAQAFDGQSRSA